MKTRYMKPEVIEIEITFISMLSTSMSIDKTSQGDSEEDFVRGHRGIWGDLWSETGKEL